MCIYLRNFVLLTVIILMTGCSTGASFNAVNFFQGKLPQKVCREYQELSYQDAQSKMNLDIYQLQQQVERSLVFREKVAVNLKQLNALANQDKPFSPKLINQLSQAIALEIELMKPILATAAKHGCWYSEQTAKLDNRIRLKGSMIALATLVSLYDEYGTVFAVISENDRLRRFLNHADSGYSRDEYLLESLTSMYVDTDMLAYVSDLVHAYHDNQEKITQLAMGDDNLAYLLHMVDTSKSYPVLLQMDFIDIANYRRKIRRRVTRDTLKEIGRATVNSLSEGFSNAVGNYEERKGLLYQDKAVEHYVSQHLQLGDILLEKTPFRLTDSMIPGHWGHAAIWIGTEQELRAIGLWQNPLVQKYYQEIQQGQLLAESLRTGTQLSHLSDFLNVDDLAIIRPKIPLTLAQKRSVVLLTLRQIGKAYDFNFDVETTDKIVCSQLVYLAYQDIDWPTESTLGRYTISPDNIATKTLDDGPLSLTLFYHQGKLQQAHSLNLMQKLMQAEVE